MITYPNNNVNSIGDQTVGRVLFINRSNPSITPRKLDSYIKDGFLPMLYIAPVDARGISWLYVSHYEGVFNEDAAEYRLVADDEVLVSTGYDVEFIAQE